jgi:hypothetical protein
VNGNSTRRAAVEPGGTGVVAHVGLHSLGQFADRLGLGDALSSRIPWAGNGVPVHDRVKVPNNWMRSFSAEDRLECCHQRPQEDHVLRGSPIIGSGQRHAGGERLAAVLVPLRTKPDGAAQAARSYS